MKTVFCIAALLLVSGCVTSHLADNAAWGNLVYSQHVAQPTQLTNLTYLGIK